MKKNNQKGVVLVMAILALLVMAIFLPALYYVVQNETQWTIRTKKTTIAFHMAEQGLDRGAWKIMESDETYDMISTGAVIVGYNFDVVYTSTGTDGQLGEYKVKLSSGSQADSVLIESIGRDRSTDEVRSLEALYTKTGGLKAGLVARAGLVYQNHFEIHWAPALCYTNITNATSLKFPRKITVGYYKNNDENPTPPNGHDYFDTWPDPATYDYNTYQTDLGNAPTVETETLKTEAKNSRIPPYLYLEDMVQDPAGSGYIKYDGSGNPKVKFEKTIGSGNVAKSYYFHNSTSVIYIDGLGEKTVVEMKTGTSTLIVKALVVDGRVSDSELDINGDSNVPVIPAVIPSGASQEYLHPDAAAAWSVFSSTGGEGATYYVSGCRVKGYIYVKGGFKNSGGSDPSIIGVLDCVGQVSVNNCIIYYDPDISDDIHTSNSNPTREYWRETKKSW